MGARAHLPADRMPVTAFPAGTGGAALSPGSRPSRTAHCGSVRPRRSRRAGASPRRCRAGTRYRSAAPCGTPSAGRTRSKGLRACSRRPVAGSFSNHWGMLADAASGRAGTSLFPCDNKGLSARCGSRRGPSRRRPVQRPLRLGGRRVAPRAFSARRGTCGHLFRIGLNKNGVRDPATDSGDLGYTF